MQELKKQEIELEKQIKENKIKENAKKLGIDLSQVDKVIISHGHNDHGGGLQSFFSINQKAKVFVVTSDYAEQINVMGAGAYRISSREFHEDFVKAKKEIAARLKIPNRALNRNELGGRVQGE